MKKLIKLISIAFFGGFIGYLTGFPIGALLGSLLAIAFVQLKTQHFSDLSTNFKKMIQALVGGGVGLSIDHDTVQSMLSPEIWLVALIIPFFHLIICLILAAILFKFFKFDLVTALCSVAPAGIGEMVLLGEKYNAVQSNVVTIHLFRMLIIIIVIPIILVIL